MDASTNTGRTFQRYWIPSPASTVPTPSSSNQYRTNLSLPKTSKQMLENLVIEARQNISQTITGLFPTYPNLGTHRPPWISRNVWFSRSPTLIRRWGEQGEVSSWATVPCGPRLSLDHSTTSRNFTLYRRRIDSSYKTMASDFSGQQLARQGIPELAVSYEFERYLNSPISIIS